MNDNEKIKLLANHSVVLIDDDCLMCNWFARFTIKHDKKDQFRFSGLKKDFGKQLLSDASLINILPDTFVLFEGGKIYIKSEAVIALLMHFQNYRWAAYLLKLFPKKFLDWLYDGFAKIRHRLSTPSSCETDGRFSEKFIS